VITEYSEDDLVAPSVWPKYYVDPDHKPWILKEYIFIRSALYRLRLAQAAFLNNVDSTPTRMPDEAQLQRFKELVASVAKDHTMVIFIYPTLENLQNKSAWLEVIAPIEGLCRTTMAKCVDIAQEPAWNERAYTSDGIHPTVEGNKILASILVHAVN
jgi:lysophospholipase L1-like esterase